ncbi:hypothetical protein E3C06_02525 [Listeria monocytogenes]|uniref:hypothetical protein n=1 Tax=Listeria monocytogenes TaxID=1639 RepID=UPI0009871B5B|nr:hypothetical protein [Listeria monocytogenes]EAC2431462.1 hypothetical protein [Listeria monocytogenes]EAC6733293.1 hypothetical protein [Listeria monocytogenes]EAD6458332.1 hypothetical protein [Listeria monocytogenes]EAD6470514.1 hypothetical protein [Listeria monocytogenes]EAD6595163.1 hypothetical protein [Listeria monocytogenes]
MTLIQLNEEIYDLTISGLRKALHDEVSEFFKNMDGENHEEYGAELEEIQTLISEQNGVELEAGFWANGEIEFLTVSEKDYVLNALQEAGYTATESNVSRSIYAINDLGNEIRISDHERPAFEVNGNYEKHEYESQIIVAGNEINSNLLIKNGFSELEENVKYYLG